MASAVIDALGCAGARERAISEVSSALGPRSRGRPSNAIQVTTGVLLLLLSILSSCYALFQLIRVLHNKSVTAPTTRCKATKSETLEKERGRRKIGGDREHEMAGVESSVERGLRGTAAGAASRFNKRVRSVPQEWTSALFQPSTRARIFVFFIPSNIPSVDDSPCRSPVRISIIEVESDCEMEPGCLTRSSRESTTAFSVPASLQIRANFSPALLFFLLPALALHLHEQHVTCAVSEGAGSQENIKANAS